MVQTDALYYGDNLDIFVCCGSASFWR